MTLSKDDKDWVKLTIRELVFEVSKEVLASHITKCPYGMKLMKIKWLISGVVFACLAIGLGNGMAPLLIKILTRLWG